jgi:DNA (cytosine-5)-methyltransferase 1
VTIGSLFAGIGGFDLGFERAGFEIKWQVEIDPFCRAVLAKHWPDVRRYEDVRTVVGWGPDARRADATRVESVQWLDEVDVICGGFPCQNISFAGDGAGLDGEQSGLWREYWRLVGELRPNYVVVENVAGLTVRGLGRVLGDLAGIGYDALWSGFSACAVGAPHLRRRLFIVAYPDREHGRAGLRDSVARAFRPLQTVDGFTDSRSRYRQRLANPSALYGGADGLPDGMDRNHGIGNSIVPQIAEWIARRILDAEAR